MAETLPTAEARPTRLSWFTILGATTIGLLALNAALLLTSSDPPPTGVPVFYWQRFNNFLYPLRCLGLIAAPICVVIWAIVFPGRRNTLKTCGTLLMAFCAAVACLGANYLSIAATGIVDNQDSIAFHGKTYQLAEFYRAEKDLNPTLLYLGACNLFGNWCVFQEIYVYDYCPGECAPHFAVSPDGRMIDVQINHNPVYSFDQFGGHCTLPKGAIDYSGGYCYYP